MSVFKLVSTATLAATMLAILPGTTVGQVDEPVSNVQLATISRKAKAKPDFDWNNKHFEAPTRLMVGDKPLNTKAKQRYPSPNMFDIDNDGDIELIVGDITGRIYVYENESKSGEPSWAPFVEMETADGKPVKVSNW